MGESYARKPSNVFIFFLFLLFSVFFVTSPVFAAPGDAPVSKKKDAPKGNDLINSSGYEGLQQEIQKLNKLGPGATLPTLIGRVLSITLQVSGTLALVMFVVGGIMFMTARGNSERSTLATKTLAWAALGVIVILSSYVIVQFLFKGIAGGGSSKLPANSGQPGNNVQIIDEETGESNPLIDQAGNRRVFRPDESVAWYCDCNISISTLVCDVDYSQTFELGDEVQVRRLLDNVLSDPSTSCSLADFAIDNMSVEDQREFHRILDQWFEVTEAECNQISLSIPGGGAISCSTR